MAAPLDLTGQRFGKLVAISVASTGGDGRRWLCECDCGQTANVLAYNLRSGNSKACGKRRVSHNPNRKHSHTRSGWVSPTYISWRAMRARCENPNRENAKYYADRGISCDPRWLSFEAFLEDMGERPEGKTLDRIDNDLGYGPDNCRWATAMEQRHNRRDSRRAA